jgi:hypothetical protein
MQSTRLVEFRVWYKSPTGGSLLEIATNDDALKLIKSRLKQQGVKFRIQGYYLVQ